MDLLTVLTPLLLGFSVVVILSQIGGYYWLNIRGNHKNCKDLSKVLLNFIDASGTRVNHKKDEFRKHFANGDSELIIWACSWPWAYASTGKILKNREVVYEWQDKMPTYLVRKRLKEFK